MPSKATVVTRWTMPRPCSGIQSIRNFTQRKNISGTVGALIDRDITVISRPSPPTHLTNIAKIAPEIIIKAICYRAQ
jgi:hypothetical protein